MESKPNLSTCCNAPIKVGGNWDGRRQGDTTYWYECTKCEKPCDVVAEPVTGVRDPEGNKNEESKK
jgi:hypothetical protein